MRKHYILTAMILSGLLLVAACAKQGYPSGGPVDRTPPKILESTPPSGTTQFSAQEFILNMDEYVTLKDADNNILISPPLKEKPEYVLKGYKLTVRLKDTLQENTTYLFQFKGAIVDFNEGNPLTTFEYVFTTGETVDSMTLRGRVLDAFTLKARKETVSVLAYRDPMADSAVALEQPCYYTRCDTSGHFALNHIAQGKYRLIALEDGDLNLLYTGGEVIAFLDTALTAQHMPRQAAPADTVADTADTAAHYNYVKPDSLASHLLLMSLETTEVQRIAKSSLLTRGHMQIITKVPLSEGYSIQHLMSEPLTLYPRLNAKGDTLDVWASRGDIDSIVVVIADSATALRDTLTLQYRYKPIKKLKIKAAHEILAVNSLVAASHPYYDTLRISFNNPVLSCDSSLAVHVLALADSSKSTAPVSLIKEKGGYALGAVIRHQGTPGAKYAYTLPKGMFIDIYGNHSDSLTINTEYTKVESYGTLKLTLQAASDSIRGHGLYYWLDVAGVPLIVQLVNEKGDLIMQRTCNMAETMVFPHLKAGKYSFRIIVDSNSDGMWTPGDYWQHRQPEEVLYYNKVLDLRENWDIEERWKL